MGLYLAWHFSESIQALSKAGGTMGRSFRFLSVIAVVIGWSPVLSLWLKPPPLIGDEAYYARVPVEMKERGDWIVPYFNGEPRYKKPPLMYWLVGAFQRFFGENEVASRLPSLAAAVLTGVLLLWLGLRTGFSETGMWAAVSFLLNPMTAILGNWGAPEAVLCFFITASLVFGLVGVLEHSTFPWLLFSGIAAGLGVLTKGAPGIILPAIVLFPIMALETRQDIGTTWSKLRKFGLKVLLWLSICSTIASPWFILVGLREGKAFWQVFFLQEHARRVAEPMEGHSGPFWFYLPIIWLLFLPWSIRLPRAFSEVPKLIKHLQASPNCILHLSMAWWAVSTILLFSSISTKLPHYTFPSFPALAWLCFFPREESTTKGELVLEFLLALLPVFGVSYGAAIVPRTYTEFLHKAGFEPAAELKAIKFTLSLIVWGFASVPIAWLFALAIRSLPIHKSRKHALLLSGVILTAVTLSAVSDLVRTSGGHSAIEAWAEFPHLATYGSDTQWAVFYAKRHIPLLGRNRWRLRKFLTDFHNPAVLSRVDFAPALRGEGLSLMRFGLWCVAFKCGRK